MNISVKNREKNQLLKREEVIFEIEFDGAIPSREQVRSALSAAISVAQDKVMIVNITNTSGIHKASGVARVYDDIESLKKDKKHLLLRDKLIEKENKTEKK